MNNWTPPARPADYAEKSIVTAIVSGDYPPGSTLPAERELAGQLGVTRPTLREALQRLARDGWLTIRQGKPTIVNNFWREGGLNVLGTLARHEQQMPVDFVPNLLEVRLAMAPAYTRAAVTNDPVAVESLLTRYRALQDTAIAFATFDWALHRMLTIASGNPIYTLILNGFTDLYDKMARHYFSLPGNRAASRAFYRALLEACTRQDADAAEEISRSAMAESIDLWQKVSVSAQAKVKESAD